MTRERGRRYQNAGSLRKARWPPLVERALCGRIWLKRVGVGPTSDSCRRAQYGRADHVILVQVLVVQSGISQSMVCADSLLGAHATK